MNKVIIISIRPQHAIRILKGKKTLELRKSIPKNFKGWVYIYVTKSKPYLGRNENYGWQHKDRFGYALYNIPHFGDLKLNDGIGDLNGKIVARFWFDCCEDFHNYIKWDRYGCPVEIPTPDNMYKKESLKKMCLTNREVYNYINYKKAYAWCIKKLEVFEDSMKLGDFVTIKTNTSNSAKLNIVSKVTKAPQSWQFAYIKGEK